MMGIFGPSKKEKAFVKNEAASLANYMKINSVKFGGEAYANLQIKDVLPNDIDESILWLFWVGLFAFRISKDMSGWRDKYGDEIFEDVYWEMSEIDNKYFRPIPHEPFKEVFSYVGMALEIISATDVEMKQAGGFFLTISKEIPIALTKEQHFMLSEELFNATKAFPTLGQIISNNV